MVVKVWKDFDFDFILRKGNRVYQVIDIDKMLDLMNCLHKFLSKTSLI